MAVSEEFLNYVVDQFRELGEVTNRKMFGGAGIYFDGKFFALLDDDELYLKVDDESRPRFKKAGSHAFEPWEGQFMNGYWSVPVDVLEDPTALAEWSQHSIKIAGTKKREKSKRTSAKGSKAPPAKRRGRSSKPRPKT